MKLFRMLISRTLPAILAGILTLAASAQTATQSVTLKPGWNAVWLEVEPQNASGIPLTPEAAFKTATNTAINIIASPKPLAGFAEFFGDAPGTESGTFNKDRWEQWNRTGVGNDLMMVTGNRGYLIKSTAGSDVTISIEGKARFFRPQWIPDRYNLVGFGLSGTPSFSNFFSPSGDVHTPAKIYRLKTDGSWVSAITTPVPPMKSGEAYWIFADGPSNYMGPVAVDFTGASSGSLNFGGPDDVQKVGAENLDLMEITFTNLSTNPAIPVIDVDTIANGTGSLALKAARPVATTLNAYELIATITGTGTALQKTITAKQSGYLTLGAARNWTSTPVSRANVYRLNTGGGTKVYLPVSALNSSIVVPSNSTNTSPADLNSGLWVGEISVNSTGSIVENGSPMRPSAGAAPLRIILHSNASGAVSLLSQVTLMQTKSADSSIPSTPALIVDPAKIPFFEGVKERNGKRVGLRVESIAFDMPRKAGAGNTEVYDLSLPLNGPLGAGKTLSTNAGTLVIDPRHRSNPFRHAYHNEHTTGPNIIREFSIVFDSEQPVPDRLTGTYQETIRNLTKSDIQLSGPVELRRVSSVKTLDGNQ